MFYLSSIQLYFHRKHSDLFVKTKEMCSAGNIQKTPEWSKALQSHSLSPLVHSNQAAKKLQKKLFYPCQVDSSRTIDTKNVSVSVSSSLPYVRSVFNDYNDYFYVNSTAFHFIFDNFRPCAVLRLPFLFFHSLIFMCHFTQFFFFFSLLLLFLPSVCVHLKMIKFSVHHIQEQHGAG